MTQYVPVPLLWKYRPEWIVWQIPAELDGIILQSAGVFVEVQVEDGGDYVAPSLPSEPLASYTRVRFRLTADPNQLGQLVYLQPLPE